MPALLAARSIVVRSQACTLTSFASFPGERGEQVKFGCSNDHGHYDVTAKKRANAQNFRKWRRRLSLKQVFKADCLNHFALNSVLFGSQGVITIVLSIEVNRF